MLYEFRARTLDDKRHSLLMKRSTHRELQTTMHLSCLTDERIANMCECYKVDYHEIEEDDRMLLINYGSIQARMNGKRHRRLSRNAQHLWDQFPDEDKNTILGFNEITMRPLLHVDQVTVATTTGRLVVIVVIPTQGKLMRLPLLPLNKKPI